MSCLYVDSQKLICDEDDYCYNIDDRPLIQIDKPVSSLNTMSKITDKSMDADSVDQLSFNSLADQQFLTSMNQYVSLMCSRFNSFQISSYNINNVKKGQMLVEHHKTMLHNIKSIVKSFESIVNDSADLLDDMMADIIQEQKEDDFVYMTSNGMLSYNGRGIVKKRAELKPNDSKQIKPLQHSMIKTTIPEIGYKLHVNHVQRLEDCKPMFSWYKDGLYCRLLPDVYVKVPFPEIYDSAKNYERRCSVRCKYKTKEICDKQRQVSAKLYNSQKRACNFAHTGDSIIKIGYSSRCPSKPNYGNPSTMSEDTKIITIDDVKSLLLYGLNDMITAAIWLDYKKEKAVFSDLTIA